MITRVTTFVCCKELRCCSHSNTHTLIENRKIWICWVCRRDELFKKGWIYYIYLANNYLCYISEFCAAKKNSFVENLIRLLLLRGARKSLDYIRWQNFISMLCECYTFWRCASKRKLHTFHPQHTHTIFNYIPFKRLKRAEHAKKL